MNNQSEQALKPSDAEAIWEAASQALQSTNLLIPGNLQASLDNWSSKNDVQKIQNQRALDATDWIEQRKHGITLTNLATQHPLQQQSRTRTNG